MGQKALSVIEIHDINWNEGGMDKREERSETNLEKVLGLHGPKPTSTV